MSSISVLKKTTLFHYSLTASSLQATRTFFKYRCGWHNICRWTFQVYFLDFPQCIGPEILPKFFLCRRNTGLYLSMVASYPFFFWNALKYSQQQIEGTWREQPYVRARFSKIVSCYQMRKIQENIALNLCLPESLLSTYDFKDIHMYINRGWSSPTNSPLYILLTKQVTHRWSVFYIKKSQTTRKTYMKTA